jgi:hypothetical protein
MIEAPLAGVPRRTNTLAVVSLVTAVIGLVLLAVGFAVAALVQTRRRGEKGKGLAIAALITSAAWTVAGVAILVLAIGSVFSVDRDESGRAQKSGKVLSSTLRAGDCFTGTPQNRLSLVEITPCGRPHDGEVIATSPLPEEPYPGDQAVLEEAADLCAARTFYLAKSPRFRDLRPMNLVPDMAGWKSGNRTVTCTVHYAGAGTLTSPLASTVDTGLKTYGELAVGDCLKNWRDDDTPVFPIVACTKPHKFQVYAVFQLPLPDVDDADYDLGLPPYPGEKEVKKLAARGCDERLEKVFAKHPLDITVDEVYVWPLEEDWNSGLTTAICMVGSRGRPLRKSVVPH